MESYTLKLTGLYEAGVIYDASVEYHLRPEILPTRKQFVIGVICDLSDHNVVGMMAISGHGHNYATYCPHQAGLSPIKRNFLTSPLSDNGGFFDHFDPHFKRQFSTFNSCNSLKLLQLYW